MVTRSVVEYREVWSNLSFVVPGKEHVHNQGQFRYFFTEFEL